MAFVLPSKYKRFWKFPNLFGFITAIAVIMVLTGCKSPRQYHDSADEIAAGLIAGGQKQLFGEEQKSLQSVERPVDLLRRRLIEEQGLIITGPESLGVDKLEQPEHWPEEGREFKGDSRKVVGAGEDVKMTLMQALQIGALNSFEYQSRKEEVYLNALALDLEMDEFRSIFNSQYQALLSTDHGSGKPATGSELDGGLGVDKKFKNGTEISADLAFGLASLLSSEASSSFGITGDATISVPLLRGSGEHIVTEPLTQAQRNLLYSMYEFERFKKTFAVDIAQSYLGVLQQIDTIKNNEMNYQSVVRNSRKSRSLTQKGRLDIIQSDQAVQSELKARQSWISAKEELKNKLDSFKIMLGLPTDSTISLDQNELQKLVSEEDNPMMKKVYAEMEIKRDEEIPPADAEIELRGLDMENAGPLEFDEGFAIKTALDNRYDLKVQREKVRDMQRKVVVAADNLRAELTLLGSLRAGSSRSISSSDLESADLAFDRGYFRSLLTLDLPVHRRREQALYRTSWINLEKSLRSFQTLEDQIKRNIRRQLRDLSLARESLFIQAKAVGIATNRVKSTNMSLEFGRAEMRDVLEAKDDLLQAQNTLTAAVVNYRISELQLQKDMGLLRVDEDGIWNEYVPQDN
ncbi:TolC family protein [Limihaloglobus sulfuriphilus]|nr:TolC family protein [Limihaloglobus sulfuriphilus]